LRKTGKKVISVLKKTAAVCASIVFCYLVFLAGTLLWTFEVKLQRQPLFIYSAPTVVRVGDDVDAIRLGERVSRIGLTPSNSPPREPGYWNQSGSNFNMYLKYCPIKGRGIVSGPISLSLDWDKVKAIKLLRSFEDTDHIVLEPELIHVVGADGIAELLRPIPIEQISPLLIDAIVLTEDPYFFSHVGVDFSSTQRAFIANLRAGRYVQGGSTISQQLVRMSILSPEKTLWRKVNEVLLALGADALYSKKTILQHYLNRVYFGHWGPYPIKGVAEAARHLFGKTAQELDPSECALLAATIRAPNVINPHRHPERARARRNMVLGLLFKSGRINRDVYEESMESPMRALRPGAATVRADAFVDLVKERLPSSVHPGGENTQDLLTSLDPLLQVDAESELRKLGSAGSKAHLVVATPKTGDVRAYVAPGSRKWTGHGGNMETFLPQALLPGLAAEKHRPPLFTLTSHLNVPDRKTPVATLRQAFHLEDPLVGRQLLLTIGVEKVSATLRQFGLPVGVKSDNVVLTRKVDPFEVVKVYAAMAMLGKKIPLKLGEEIHYETLSKEMLMDSGSRDAGAIFLVNHMLKDFTQKDVMQPSGDATSIIASEFAAADSDGRWHVSYRPDAMVLLRIGGHDASRERLNKALKTIMPLPDLQTLQQETVPDGIVFRNICLSSGLLATSTCPKVLKEAFFRGTQPTEWCHVWHETAPMSVFHPGK